MEVCRGENCMKNGVKYPKIATFWLINFFLSHRPMHVSQDLKGGGGCLKYTIYTPGTQLGQIKSSRYLNLAYGYIKETY